MKIINEQLLLSFVEKNQLSVQFELYLKKFRVRTSSSLESFTLQDIKALCLKINSRASSKATATQIREEEALLSWKKGQLKLYLWFLVYCSYTFKMQISKFKEAEFQFFKEVFLTQNSLRLKYEIHCLVPPKTSYKASWLTEEIALFHSIISTHQEKGKRMEWKSVAYDLFNLSLGQFFKTNAQCRERWLNHMNPQIIKREWSREQDYLMMVAVQEYGTKWSQIAKQFQGSRTEHMVKNRYLSLINKWKTSKKTNKQIELKILSTIRRNLERKAKVPPKKNSQSLVVEETVDHQNSSEHTHETHETHKLEEKEVEVKIPEFNSNNDLNFYQGEESYCHEFKESEEKLIENSNQKIPGCIYFKFGPTSYRDESLKETIEDIVQKLGCGHAERIDMFFEGEEQWAIEPEEY